MNKFELFMDKISDMPLYIKQLMYTKLSVEMKNFGCQDVLDEGENFSSYVPTLTFKGETELLKRTNGFDSNIYSFLEFCKKGFSVAEISVNKFLTMEETAKLFVFCSDESYIELPENNILAVAEYLSGKTRLGEYLLSIKRINSEQLNSILNNYDTDKKFGEILIDLGYVTSKDIKSIIMLKSEAQKRFVLDCDITPISQTVCVSNDNHELSNLKSENKKLKAQLNKLLELVK